VGSARRFAAAAAADVVKAAPFLPCFPDTGSKLSCCPLPKNRTAVFRQPPSEAQLPSSGRETIGETTELSTLSIESSACNRQILSAPERRAVTEKKYDFSVKWVLGQIPNKPHRWENVPTEALLASL